MDISFPFYFWSKKRFVLNVVDAHLGGYYQMTVQPHDEDYPSTSTPIKFLSLTRNEALYLDDSLTMMLDTTEGMVVFATMRPMASTICVPAPVDLIEKIAIAVLSTLDTENEGREAVIEVNEGDLYCLRELAQSYVRIGEEQVGYNLKRKIYKALYGTEYILGRQLEEVLDGFTPMVKDPETIVAPSRDDEF